MTRTKKAKSLQKSKEMQEKKLMIAFTAIINKFSTSKQMQQ
jgi:hypothetical protein